MSVDLHARMDVDILRVELEKRLRRQQAVYAVVAIIGSTEEGAVDPLDEILALRDEFGARGLSFVVHADAAWGGYFTTMIRTRGPTRPPRDKPDTPRTGSTGDLIPAISLRPSTARQLHALGRADSITVDPHKAGYIPYPA